MQRLERLIMDTINEVIREVFNDEVAKILFDNFFEKNSSVSFDKKLRAFEDSLPRILGSGAIIIEDLILETLYSRLGVKFEREDKSFTDSIMELRLIKVES
ncbi:hypothetical protein DRO64_05265 [Candidatus Bathyarchaeota archaeon]|nr:MAG: hypothetical protein DRO64_05265 [Candidatus Bathyarchaeota archaeon]